MKAGLTTSFSKECNLSRSWHSSPIHVTFHILPFFGLLPASFWHHRVSSCVPHVVVTGLQTHYVETLPLSPDLKPPWLGECIARLMPGRWPARQGDSFVSLLLRCCSSVRLTLRIRSRLTFHHMLLTTWILDLATSNTFHRRHTNRQCKSWPEEIHKSEYLLGMSFPVAICDLQVHRLFN